MTINGKTVKMIVEFICFFLEINECNDTGRFILKCRDEEGTVWYTSHVRGIHIIDNVRYVETSNSLYQIDSSSTIIHLEEVKEFIENDGSSATKFFDNCNYYVQDLFDIFYEPQHEYYWTYYESGRRELTLGLRVI